MHAGINAVIEVHFTEGCPLPHSYAETLTLTCANCERYFDAEFWLIVDTWYATAWIIELSEKFHATS